MNLLSASAASSPSIGRGLVLAASSCIAHALKTPVASLLCFLFLLCSLATCGALFSQKHPHPAPYAMSVPRTPVAHDSIAAVLSASEKTTAFTAPPASADDMLIAGVQRRLNSLGYAAGPANGRLDSATRRAVLEFEKDYRLPLTGSIQAPLLKTLANATPRR